MRKSLVLLFLCLSLSIPGVTAQVDNSYRIAQLIAGARVAIFEADLNRASQLWHAAQTLLEETLPSPLCYGDPRYYYVTRWLAKTMVVEDRNSEAEPWLKNACSRDALILSLRNDDVKATTDVFAEILKKNGKPGEAQDVIALWKAIQASETTSTTRSPSALQSASLPLANAEKTNTPSASSLLNGSSARKKAIEELQRELLSTTPAPPAVPIVPPSTSN